MDGCCVLNQKYYYCHQSSKQQPNDLAHVHACLCMFVYVRERCKLVNKSIVAATVVVDAVAPHSVVAVQQKSPIRLRTVTNKTQCEIKIPFSAKFQ